MNRLTFRPLMPATASLLIHLGLGGIAGMALDQAPVRMPVLIAELVEAEAPPAVEPPPRPAPPIVRKRPVIPPKPLATPLPAEPSVPPRPEPEPPPATVPEPPEPAASEPPRPAAPEPPKPAPPVPPAVATAEPTLPTRTGPEQPPPTDTARPRDLATPPVSVPPDAGLGAFATAPPAVPGPHGGSASSSAREPGVAALPPDGVTQRAIPRGGYQYRPAYPSSARRLGIQGTTLLHVLVGDTGRVVEVIVKQSAGHSDLDQAAADAVRRWRFEPARRGTEPVEMWVQLPFEFRLR
jgi:periplasmic protein TonB